MSSSACFNHSSFRVIRAFRVVRVVFLISPLLQLSLVAWLPDPKSHTGIHTGPSATYDTKRDRNPIVNIRAIRVIRVSSSADSAAEHFGVAPAIQGVFC